MSTQTTERRMGQLKAGDASLPLTKMEVSGTITGLLHRTKVCQTFVNDHKVPLEAIYTHPLPPKASVHGFRLVIGQRVVEGVVQERQAARQAYAQAVAKGHRAALMEEDRSDIFTTTVGNIAPGEQVSITFELSGPLEFLESTASLRFPLVVPELFISGAPLGGGDVGDGVTADTTSVPDASRITPPRLAPGAANPINLKLGFTVDPAGLELEKVESLCHFVKTRSKDDGTYEISLLPGVERLDRDFVISLKLKQGSLQTTLVHDQESGTFALTVVPPLGSGAQVAPRDLVIVLDRSGSMEGWSMTAARRAAARMVEALTPQDRFALIAFDDRLEMLDPHLVTADLRHKERAQEFLTKVEARGGTQARPAIEQALQMLKGETSSDKTVLFLTDGDVGNDAELVVRSSAGVRVSTVGIGHNSRAGVLDSMAKVSGGLCSLIPDEKTLEESLRNLHQRLGRPHWMGLSLQGLSVEHQAPRFWDVWEGVPTTFFGRCKGLGSEVTVEGWLASTGHHSQKVAVRRRDDLVIHRSWARARLLDLDDLWTIGKAQPSELVAVSVDAQVLCRFTAFTAIDSSEVVSDSQAMKTVVQPVEATLKPKMMMMQSRAAAPSHRLSRSVAPSPPPPPSPAPGFFGDSADDDVFGCSQSVAELFGDAEVDCFAAPVERAESEAPLRSQASQDFGAMEFECQESGWLPPASEAPPTPLRRMAAPASPPPRAVGGVDKAKKERAAPSLWERLLNLLKGLANAGHNQRAAILNQMMEALGEHCRKAAAGSAEAQSGREIMSLLVDLQQAYQDNQDPASATAALSDALNALI